MKAKNILLLAFAFWLAGNLQAQTNLRLSPVVKPTQGGSNRIGNLQFDYTIGEPAQKTLRNGNLVFTQGFEQPHLLETIVVNVDIQSLPDTLYTCKTDSFHVQIANTSSVYQRFSLKIATANSGIASSFVLDTSVYMRDTVIGGDIYLIADSFPANRFDNILYSFKTGCGAIPVSGISTGQLQHIISISDYDTLGQTAIQSFKINNQAAGYPDTLTFPFQFPYLIQSSTTNVNPTLSIGEEAEVTIRYQNLGTGPYNGFLAFNNVFGCHDSILDIQQITIDTGGITMDSIINPSFPDSMYIQIARNGFFEVIFHIKLNDCISGGACNGIVRPKWGCDDNLCRVTTDSAVIHVTPENTTPYVMISRILPVANPGSGNEAAWDAACTNTETTWEYLIVNRGTAAALDVSILLNSQFATHTMVRKGTVELLLHDPRFPDNGIPAFDTSFFKLSSSELGVDGPVNCYNRLDDTASYMPIDSFVLAIPELLPEQYIVLRFKTWRCCANDNDYNTGVTYNQWTLTGTFRDCAGPRITNDVPSFYNFLLHETFSNGGFITPTYYAYPHISSHFDDSSPSDLGLVQNFNQTITDITGGPGTCGAPKLFTIRNMVFPSLTSTDWDSQVFCDGATSDPILYPAVVTGTNPRGQFRFEFVLDPGLQMDSAAPTITKSGITWVASIYNVIGNSATAIFDIDGQFIYGGNDTTINQTAFDFRTFFTESGLNFLIKGCCSGDNNPARPGVTVNTLFSPDINGQGCDTCFIPLWKTDFELQLHCPGCITPGIITEDFKLRRINYGFKDIDNNGLPDGSSLSIIAPGYMPLDSLLMNLNGSIAGDTLRGIAEAYLTDGDPTTGFSYAQWQAFWSDTINHLYFEEHIVGANTVGMKCIDAKFEYTPADTTLSIITFNIPGISDITPLLPNVNEYMLFHIPVDSLGNTAQIKPADKFKMICTYIICDNPSAEIEMEVITAMYASVNALSGYPYFGGTTLVGDIYEHEDSIYRATIDSTGHINEEGYDPSDPALFMCEAFSAVHHVYPITNEYVEYWGNETSCHQTAALEVNYKIEGPYTNIFNYEFRPVPGINLGQTHVGPQLTDNGPVIFHFGVPAGYTAQVFYSKSIIQRHINPFQSVYITATIADNVIDSNVRFTGPYGYDYRLNLDSAVYSLPFASIVNSAITVNGSKRYFSGGKPCLLLGDESFNQVMYFNITPVCSTHSRILDSVMVDSVLIVAPHLNTDTINKDSVYIVLPDYSNACNSAVQDLVVDDNTEYYLSVPEPVINASLLSPTITGQYINQPIKLEVIAADIDNFIYYIDIGKDDLPSGVEIDCFSSLASCTGGTYAPHVIKTLTDTFNRYFLGTFLAGNKDTVHLNLHVTNCDSIGRHIKFPVYYSWSCDSLLDSLPSKANLCDIPDSLTFDIVLPKPNLIVQKSVDAGPYNTCVPIHHIVSLQNLSPGALGELYAQIKLQEGVVIDSQALIIDSAAVPIAGYFDSIIHYAIDTNSNDTLWLVYFQNSTAFDSFSTVRVNGLSSGDKASLHFWLRADCHTDTIEEFNVEVYGKLYCGANFNEVADSIIPDSIVYAFTRIPITGNGCGPYVNAEILNAPCYGSMLVTTSLGVIGVPPLDTVWLPAIPDFATPDTGYYYVTVVDTNGCKGMDTIYVPQPFSLDIKIIGSHCDGNGFVALACDTLPPGSYSYLWSTGSVTDTIHVVPADGITHMLSVTDALGCTHNASKIVYGLALSLLKCTDNVFVKLYGGLGDISGGEPPYIFTWTDENGDTLSNVNFVDTANTYFYEFDISETIADSIFLTLSDSKGCTVLDYVVNNGAVRDTGFCCFHDLQANFITIKDSSLSSDLNNVANSKIFVLDSATFIINDTLFLEGCEIVLGCNSKIVILDSAALYLFGTYLHGCKKMWDGIYAEPRGCIVTDTIDNKRCKIEDAINGIFAHSINGATVLINNTDFARNQTSITLGGYVLDDSARFNISGCTFGMGDYSQMLPAPTGLPNYARPLQGVKLVFSGPVLNIPNPALEDNRPNTFSDMNCGISMSLCGRVNIYNNFFERIRNYDSLTYNGAGAALYSYNQVIPFLIGEQSLLVETDEDEPGESSPEHFKNCDYGIYAFRSKINVAHNRMDSVTHCIKTIDGVNRTWVSENFLTNTNHGITINNGVYADNQVWGNTIFVNDPYFTGDLVGGVFYNTYGICHSEVNNGIPIASSIFTNSIWNGRNSIFLHNAHGTQVFLNDIHQTSTTAVSGSQSAVYVSNCQAMVVEANTIIGNGTTYNDQLNPALGNSANKKSGISLYRSIGEICGNTMDSIGYGVYFASECYDCNLRNNIFERGKFGVVLKSSGSTKIIGDQGYQLVSVAQRHQNQFEGDGSLIHEFAGNFRTYSFINIPDSLLYDPPNFFYTGIEGVSNTGWSDSSNAILNGTEVIAAAVVAQLITTPDSNITDYECVTLIAPTVTSWDMLVAGGYGENYMEAGLAETGNWLTSKRLYNKLTLDTSLLAFDTILRLFYDSISTTAIGQMNIYEQRLRQQKDSAIVNDTGLYNEMVQDSKELNADIGDNTQRDANYVQANGIYLNRLQNSIDTFSEAEIEFLSDLAVQCPYLAGDAVYTARALLAQVESHLFFDDVELCNIGGGSKKEDEPEKQENRTQQQIESIRVYPNPTNNQLNIAFQAIVEGQAQFELFNGIGQIVKTEKIHQSLNFATFDVSRLPVGIYFWRLKDSNRTISAGKVSIAR